MWGQSCKNTILRCPDDKHLVDNWKEDEKIMSQNDWNILESKLPRSRKFPAFLQKWSLSLTGRFRVGESAQNYSLPKFIFGFESWNKLHFYSKREKKIKWYWYGRKILRNAFIKYNIRYYKIRVNDKLKY